MRNKVVPVVLALAIGLGGFVAGRLAAAPSATPTARGRAVHHYACPMHPAVKSDRPGAAPCCGMALEPVYEDGPAASAATPARPAGAVTADAGLRQLQGVRLGVVERAATSHPLRLFGRVVPDEARVYTVNAAMEGAIHELAPVTTGSFVRRGQRLGAFFSADMRTALQAFMTALDVIDLDPARRAQAGLTVAAGSSATRNALYVVERLKSLGMSDRQLEEMRQRREVPLFIDIAAPADGLVVARSVTAGQKYDKGAEWFRIANLDRVWILADLAQGDVALVRPGAPVRVTVPGRAEPLAAVVSRVPPQFDPASRTMKVRLEADNPGTLLRPDMLVDAELSVERPEALVVPADAVVDTGLRRTVFVEQAAGLLVPRAVETGWRHGDQVEITRGLAAGERIVLSATFLVDSESQLRAAAAGAPAVLAPGASPAAVRDPVCGMEVDAASARAAGRIAEHQGHTVAFCSDGCRERFLTSPEAYVAGAPHDHAVHAGHVALKADGSHP